MLPLIPLVIAAGATYGAGYAVYRKVKGKKMTAKQKAIYEAALKEKDPVKLRALADGFDKAGLKKEAELLRKRALIGEKPPSEKRRWRRHFKAGMKAKDPQSIDNLAKAFESQGATDAAAKLRQYSKGLKAQQASK